MQTFPLNSPDVTAIGIPNARQVQRNLPVAVLVERAIERGEGLLSARGALACTTGKYTGRSPKDRFIVDEPTVHDRIDWGAINQPYPPEAFDRLYDRLMAYLQGRDLFVFDGFVGADPRYRVPVRIINEYAWHNLFVHQLFIRPEAKDLLAHNPQFTVVCAPGFLADPQADGTRSEAFVVISFTHGVVIIGGTQYAGEMKKSIFSTLNYLLPLQGVLPMHCSANVGPDGKVALYFGLSGTGKTTLSSDPGRRLIGDDEHGWTDAGVFNFEGGCYAKAIRLRPEGEPLIWNAVKFGAVLENVVVDPESRAEDWDSAQLTENSRVAYPIHFVPDAVGSGMGGHPEVVFFLTADAYGVLPPISRLDRAQAEYHFLAGYTSKVAGTERGLTGTEATFSTLFGAPFFPLPAKTYAAMLGERLDKYGSRVYLVNTGWCGDAADPARKRINLAYTRAMVNAAIDGDLDKGGFVKHPVFGVMVPKRCPGVPDKVLDPASAWPNPAAYERAAKELAARFEENRLNPGSSGAG